MELVQSQQHSGHRVSFSCGNCGSIQTVSKSLYTVRMSNSKSGNLFCSSRCHGMYRRNHKNKKEESAEEIFENFFKKKALRVVGGERVGEGRLNAPTQFFSVGDAQIYIIAQEEQEKKMAERMTWEELQAKYSNTADKVEFIVDPENGSINMVINNEGDGATRIPEAPQAPTPPQTPQAPQTSSAPTFTPGAGLRIGGGNNRRTGGRYGWEYTHNSSVLLIECDAGNHDVPDAFLATIVPEGQIWSAVDGVRKVQQGPYAKCTYVMDDLGNTERTYVNIIGLAQFLNPEAYPDYDSNNKPPNHGQYRPGGICNRCMGQDELGNQYSKGMMTTMNLAFNYSFDKLYKIIPQDMSWEQYLTVRGLKLPTPSSKLAVPINEAPAPEEHNPFKS